MQRYIDTLDRLERKLSSLHAHSVCTSAADLAATTIVDEKCQSGSGLTTNHVLNESNHAATSSSVFIDENVFNNCVNNCHRASNKLSASGKATFDMKHEIFVVGHYIF